jgi:20S proteasome alpha/beta subunit
MFFITHIHLIVAILLIIQSNLCYCSLFGFTTNDAVVLSSSGVIDVHDVMLRSDFDWIRDYDGICLGLQGKISDCEYIFTAVDYHRREFQDESATSSLTAKSIAHLCRNIIGSHLRQGQLQVNGLVGGRNWRCLQPLSHIMICLCACRY